jgi:hypothetical protein
MQVRCCWECMCGFKGRERPLRQAGKQQLNSSAMDISNVSQAVSKRRATCCNSTIRSISLHAAVQHNPYCSVLLAFWNTNFRLLHKTVKVAAVEH